MGHKPPRRSRTRAERHTQIIEARARGESLADTAARLGISRSYYHELLNDPTGAKVEARRRRYQKPCPTCGKPMTGSNGHTGAPKLCAMRHNRAYGKPRMDARSDHRGDQGVRHAIRPPASVHRVEPSMLHEAPPRG